MKQQYKDIHRYADGGKVVSTETSHPDKPKTPAPTPPPPSKDTVQGAQSSGGGIADTLKNQRERQMKELGLADGGMPRLGSGARFRAVEASARASGARNPAAVAAAAGRKKYGAKKMAAMAAAGRRKK